VIQWSMPVGHSLVPGSGFDHWLVKPIDSDSLYAVLDCYPSAMRLLLVDDDPSFVRLLRRMIEARHRGYDVSWAHNGEDALAMMREHLFDLVMLDISLPGLSGRDVAAMLTGQVGAQSAAAETGPNAVPSPARRPALIAVTAGRPEATEPDRAARAFAVTYAPGIGESDLLALTKACLAQLRPDYAAEGLAVDSP